MMNAELLDKNFGVCFPEELDGCLDVQQGSANCCKFNRWGSMVAVGSIDGRVYIFDVITKGVVKARSFILDSWMCHGYPITALSWSRNGRKLLTAATDWSVAIWDVMEATRLERFVYGSPIISAMFNPRDEYQVLVVYLSGNPVVEHVKAKQQKEIRFHGTGDDQVGDVTVATFDRRGKFIVTGSSKGRIAFYDSKTIRMITYVKQNASHQIKNIVLTRRGDFLLTNSQDRIIRTYNLNDLLKKHQGAVVEPMQKLLDIVNKGESLHDVQWHPTRPIILSVANGLVSVWTQAHVENWSAFAPEFTELEENTKYIERESEFDLEDEDADEPSPHTSQEDDDEVVDVVTLKANAVYCSSDEDDDGSSFVTDLTGKNGPLWFLPISPEVENPEENPLSLLYDSENGSNNQDSDYSAGLLLVVALFVFVLISF
ncbi:unnamed protein product [Toxocara canis]|uniref:WD_REPEATS_REGION domain-containing protein n=1 Tax=Toxocara canis TaxID=6265 RepID=A0A183V904_TOXCA|nr:unnamed protein product [Toxocara canis]